MFFNFKWFIYRTDLHTVTNLGSPGRRPPWPCVTPRLQQQKTPLDRHDRAELHARRELGNIPQEDLDVVYRMSSTERDLAALTFRPSEAAGPRTWSRRTRRATLCLTTARPITCSSAISRVFFQFLQFLGLNSQFVCSIFTRPQLFAFSEIHQLERIRLL